MKKIAFLASLPIFVLLLLLSSRMGGQAADLTEPPQETMRIYMPFISKPSPIANHNFEQGTFGWQQSPLNGFPLIVDTGFEGFGVTPRSGSWLAWLSARNEEAIMQELTVPVNTPYFTYWYWIDSVALCGSDFGGVKVISDNLPLLEEYSHNLCEDENSSEWMQHGVDLSVYAGQTITLQLHASTASKDGADFSHLFIDDLAFTAVP